MLARHPAAVVALVALLSFAPALGAGFVYDDVLLIEQNVRVQRFQGFLDAFRNHFWETDARDVAESSLIYYRPLVTVSFTLDWLVFQGKAWGFHVVNVLLHALAAFLATRLALRWLRRPALALLLGVLFAAHPTRPESVVWIAGRTDLLMTVFALLAVEAAHQARLSAHGRSLNAACVVAFVAAMLCKEGAFVLPLLLWADATNDEPQGLSVGSKRLLGLCLTLGTAYAALRLFVYPVRPDSGAALNFQYGLVTVATYAERLVWPFPQTFFYRSLMRDQAGLIYPPHLLVLGAALCAGYCWLLFVAWRRDRVAALSLLTALAVIGPVLNFLETGIAISASDHFLYLPLLLLSLGVARLLMRPLERLTQQAAAALAAALAILCFIPNAARAADFRDDDSLWQSELAVDPTQPLALDWLATRLAREGDLQAALAALERSFSPEASAYALLSRRSLSNGRWLKAVELKAALTPDGDARTLDLLYTELLGFWQGKRGPRARIGWLELGLEREQAATARSASRRARSFLAAKLAVVASRLGRTEEARSWLERVDGSDVPFLPTPLPFVLAAARSGDFAAARRILAQLEAGDVAVRLDEQLMAQLGQRLSRAEQLARSAGGAPRERAPLLASLSQLELSGYLNAARQLRPLYVAAPANQEVAQLYAQALLAARLDAQARRVVEAALGAEEAGAVVASVHASLSPFLRDLPPAPDGDGWWRH